MENYIKKINDRLINSGNAENAKKVKFSFQLSGGLMLGFGIAGFLASFITFLVLFLKFKTDEAFIAWYVAIPFLLLIVVGAVLARIGDTLLPEKKTSIDKFADNLKSITKYKKKNSQNNEIKALPPTETENEPLLEYSKAKEDDIKTED